MAAAVRSLWKRGAPAARAHEAQGPTEAAAYRDGGVRGERRAGPRQPAHDRGDRPEALGDRHRTLHLAGVRQDPTDVLVVLRLLIVGRSEGQRMAAAGHAVQRDT